ncbi:MAG: hypothetical protein EXR79_06515 [Myxococcales bacterium]|nr:hypothetical protein [Myxococcales bacterium]
MPTTHLAAPRGAAWSPLGALVSATALCAAVASAGLLSSSAWAQSVSAADLKKGEAKAEEAKSYFKSGLFSEAADAFMEAYANSKRPDMIYNAARALEEAKAHAKALALFARYEGLAAAPEDGRKDARQRIARLQPLVEEQRAEAANPPAAAVPAQPPPVAVQPAPAAIQSAPTAAPTAPAPGFRVTPTALSSAKQSASVAVPPPRWASWTLFGSGLVLVLTGLGGVGSANDDIDKISATFRYVAYHGAVDKGVTDYRAQVKSHEQLAAMGSIVALGGLALAGWGGWRLWGPQPAVSTARSLRVVPTFSAAGSAVALEAAW